MAHMASQSNPGSPRSLVCAVDPDRGRLASAEITTSFIVFPCKLVKTVVDTCFSWEVLQAELQLCSAASSSSAVVIDRSARAERCASIHHSAAIQHCTAARKPEGNCNLAQRATFWTAIPLTLPFKRTQRSRIQGPGLWDVLARAPHRNSCARGVRYGLIQQLLLHNFQSAIMTLKSTPLTCGLLIANSEPTPAGGQRRNANECC